MLQDLRVLIQRLEQLLHLVLDQVDRSLQEIEEINKAYNLYLEETVFVIRSLFC